METAAQEKMINDLENISDQDLLEKRLQRVESAIESLTKSDLWEKVAKAIEQSPQNEVYGEIQDKIYYAIDWNIDDNLPEGGEWIVVDDNIDKYYDQLEVLKDSIVQGTGDKDLIKRYKQWGILEKYHTALTERKQAVALA